MATPNKSLPARASGPRGSAGDDAVARTSTELLRRVPPHNVEAEQAVLGGIFFRNNVFHTLADTLSADDFYLPAHRTLFTAFLELYRKNAPIDLVATAAYLKDRGELENVGGAAYLAELAQTVVSGANAEYYEIGRASCRERV